MGMKLRETDVMKTQDVQITDFVTSNIQNLGSPSVVPFYYREAGSGGGKSQLAFSSSRATLYLPMGNYLLPCSIRLFGSAYFMKIYLLQVHHKVFTIISVIFVMLS